MTRAKQALFMLVPERPKASSSVRETDLLRDTLAGDGPSGARFAGLPVLYASGDPAWFERPAGRPAPLPAPAAVRPAQVTFEIEAIRREPSKDRAEDRPFPAPWLFGEDAGGVRAFGSAIHRLFERIEWIEDADIEGVVAAWREEAMESAAVRRDVEAQFRNCAASPEVRAVLARPAGAARCEVWRETPFDWVRETGDGPEIVTGRFDRVVVERDASGRPLRATVVDFKSNRVADERQMAETAEGYRGQMRDYAAAAARLLGLPAAAVKAKLLFTRLGRVAELHGWEHLPETRRSTAPK
jgi:ATP-dependent helicase/nuclease subunit A